ncbi:MAG: hypothetical protein ACYDDU_15260 [Dermatophilaceae bacterium]
MQGRPRLKSHVQPLRRSPGSLQFGVCPNTGVILDGLSNAEIAVVEGLDGSLDIHTLYAGAAAAGVAAGRLSALIATLDEHHLLVDAATDRACMSSIDEPRRQLLQSDATAVAAAYGLSGDGFDHVAARLTQHVVIGAEGDLPCALADLLRIGGIGKVSVGANAVNTLDLDLRRHPGGGTRATFGSTSKLPDLVVLAAMGAISPDAGEPWRRLGTPHLPVVVQGHRVQVGPLITGDGGPCLSCLDLHRRDRDAAWPALLSQLAPAGPFLPSAPVSLESTLTAMTIGAAAMIVHTCLDGQPVSDDLSLELSLPWPTIQNRRWFPHPLCDCMVGQATMTG